MAKAEQEIYESKAIISTIKATSRASVKIGDSYYTMEYCEERVIPDIDDVDIATERQILWDTVNAEVDNQINDIMQAIKNNR